MICDKKHRNWRTIISYAVIIIYLWQKITCKQRVYLYAPVVHLQHIVHLIGQYLSWHTRTSRTNWCINISLPFTITNQHPLDKWRRFLVYLPWHRNPDIYFIGWPQITWPALVWMQSQQYSAMVELAYYYINFFNFFRQLQAYSNQNNFCKPQRPQHAYYYIVEIIVAGKTMHESK